MKLSDAISLGRVLLKPKAQFLVDGEGGGCALGMGLIAIGFKVQDPRSIAEPVEVWPWLEEWVERPCCSHHPEQGGDIITHIFDDHIMRMSVDERWTLDQLIDWVRKVEPREEIPVTEQQGVECAQDAQPVSMSTVWR
jgi:hypothetical protein